MSNKFKRKMDRKNTVPRFVHEKGCKPFIREKIRCKRKRK